MLSVIPKNCCFMPNSSTVDPFFMILASEFESNAEFVEGKRGSIDSEGRWGDDVFAKTISQTSRSA